jgi:hypothetical protein
LLLPSSTLLLGTAAAGLLTHFRRSTGSNGGIPGSTPGSTEKLRSTKNALWMTLENTCRF